MYQARNESTLQPIESDGGKKYGPFEHQAVSFPFGYLYDEAARM
jgi:hypothetical protein